MRTREYYNEYRKNDIANLRSARIIKEVSLMMIQFNETTEKLLKRIVETRLGSGSGTGLHLMCDCMIEHLIHEEARRLGVTDQDIEKEMIR